MHLAQFSVTPSLDFRLNAAIQQLEAVSKPFTDRTENQYFIIIFKTFTQKHQAHLIEPDEKSELKHWKEFFTSAKAEVQSTNEENLQLKNTN